ncbi:hypothetical protein [Geopsychrobacter electrodiphilus]|uniref:hypothetical protein n=1 Tax=Geopsychrobacter electrodiphilus TaxID=225196 RepID=UPI0012EBA0BA|nr:hypothetical protein [Geopsychrobacter electrodiphilus]
MKDFEPGLAPYLSIRVSLKFAVILILFVVFYVSLPPKEALAQDAVTPVEAGESIPPVQVTKDSGDSATSSVLKFVYGKSVRDGILILPYGIHTQTKSKSIAHNNCFGLVYNSFSVGTFINSFHERTWYLVAIRNLIAYHGFGLDYFAGVLYGYKGKLATVSGVPFRNSFLFKHNFNPILSLDTWYELTDHIQLQVTYTPLVVLGGIKYNF